MRSPDVFIVGGGIVGLTTAYFLAKAGAAVTVADRGELGQEASWAGAGIIPPVPRFLPIDPLERLRAFSAERFGRFSNELKEQTGIDNEFHVCGGIECLDAEDRSAVELWNQLGIKHLRIESPDWLRPIGEVNLYSLRYAQVRNPRHMAALIEAGRLLGVKQLPNQPIDPLNLPPAKQYLFAVGAWADEMLAPYGLPPLVHPVRGQIVLFKPSRPVVPEIVIVGHRYLVPRLDGRVLVGSTEEPEAGFVKGNTPERVNGLIRFARELVPGLAEAEVEKTWSGLRPGSRDGMPYLGRVPGTVNCFAAVGHFRAGVQLSPGSGEVMAAMLMGQPPPVPIEAFRLDRPPAPAQTPIFRA